MTTQLGIITNYSEPETLTMDPELKDPREIKLDKWFGITNNKQEMSSNLKKLTNDINNKSDFLKNNFVDKFESHFNKLHSRDGQPTNLEDTVFSEFDVKKLIIIYLEATKDNENKWNTDDSNDNNRIYLFDRDGNELKTTDPITQVGQNAGLTKFFGIKIDKNVLSILRDGKPVPFSVVDTAAMTLARLISSLLGQEIQYKKSNEEQGPYEPEYEREESALPPPDDTSYSDIRRASESDINNRQNDNTMMRSQSVSSVNPNSNVPERDDMTNPINPLIDNYVNPEENKNKNPFATGGKGKKSRKKQRKGGKKSMKKQRKSMRKMKRSRSKK